MSAGKIIAGGLVLTAAVAGVAMYWLQEYAYYVEVDLAGAGGIGLVPLSGGAPASIPAEDLRAIDAESSPLRFRACFTTPLGLPELSETYQSYAGPVPLNAPSWFDCFDAGVIGAALEAGQALAFLAQAGIAPQTDRVVAVFPDGRAYAWHQIAPGGEE
ncbi:MAG: DUF6446 family protein [Paracoccaceae bacterium]